MIRRSLYPVVFAPEWGRQMRFLAGPRQCGKTTLARALLKKKGDEALYYNWDKRELRMRHHRGEDFLKTDLLQAKKKTRRWVCFDEIHKMPRWKNILKSYFDAYEEKVIFLVTGSARLDLFRRAGDSLAGRYFLFHLFPLNLFELTRTQNASLRPQPSAKDWVESRLSSSRKADASTLEALLEFSGFPEPFQKAHKRFHRLWQREYLDHLIWEDLRDLTRIEHLENVAALALLLPERIGSPLSVNSLREDLELNHKTLRNYLAALRLLYFLFEVPPYSRRIARALRKEKKVYFHDWTLVPEEGVRFENYVAAELLNWVTAWNDAGEENFSLRYLRTREGKECDFLILREAQPWLLMEAELKAGPVPAALFHFSKNLGGIPVVQVVREEGVLRAGRKGEYNVSASRFFSA